MQHAANRRLVAAGRNRNPHGLDGIVGELDREFDCNLAVALAAAARFGGNSDRHKRRPRAARGLQALPPSIERRCRYASLATQLANRQTRRNVSVNQSPPKQLTIRRRQSSHRDNPKTIKKPSRSPKPTTTANNADSGTVTNVLAATGTLDLGQRTRFGHYPQIEWASPTHCKRRPKMRRAGLRYAQPAAAHSDGPSPRTHYPTRTLITLGTETGGRSRPLGGADTKPLGRPPNAMQADLEGKRIQLELPSLPVR